MLTTKRYDYIPFETVQKHPMIANHRVVNQQKVRHYKTDILNNGLLEPLVVWERNPRELFLVGGFHRHAAIELIRQENPGYYDRLDVRVVAGDFEEIRALNLKLNADRLDAKLVEYFDTVIYLNNANWDKERIASFLDKSVSWIEDIIRFAPSMDSRIRSMLHNDKISWTKAKATCRRIMSCEPGQEHATTEAAIRELQEGSKSAPKRAISMRSAKTRLAKVVAANPNSSYTVRAKDLLSLLTLLGDKNTPDTEGHLERVRECFPSLVDAACDPVAAKHSSSSKQTGEAAQSE
jgi:ParB-like chromosome segregation protein Spo0J